MSCWLVLSIVLASGVAVLAPQQMSVLLNKLFLVTLSAYLGYWISRSATPYARPGDLLALLNRSSTDEPPTAWELLLGRLAASAMIARSILMAAAIVGTCLGL